MKQPTCKICGERKVKQQERKTEQEKNICLTCSSFIRFCEDTLSALQLVADEKKIKRLLFLDLIKDTRTSEDCLMDAIEYSDGKRRIFFN